MTMMMNEVSAVDNPNEFIRQQNSIKGFDNQAQGMRLEFKVLRSFKCRSDVLFAIRSAGSHSAIDIVVQFKSGKQFWIVCKVNQYIEPRERIELSKVIQKKPDHVEVRMYYYSSPKIMKYTKLA